jgi:hypothetical protein
MTLYSIGLPRKKKRPGLNIHVRPDLKNPQEEKNDKLESY